MRISRRAQQLWHGRDGVANQFWLALFFHQMHQSSQAAASCCVCTWRKALRFHRTRMKSWGGGWRFPAERCNKRVCGLCQIVSIRSWWNTGFSRANWRANTNTSREEDCAWFRQTAVQTRTACWWTAPTFQSSLRVYTIDRETERPSHMTRLRQRTESHVNKIKK